MKEVRNPGGHGKVASVLFVFRPDTFVFIFYNALDTSIKKKRSHFASNKLGGKRKWK